MKNPLRRFSITENIKLSRKKRDIEWLMIQSLQDATLRNEFAREHLERGSKIIGNISAQYTIARLFTNIRLVFSVIHLPVLIACLYLNIYTAPLTFAYLSVFALLCVIPYKLSRMFDVSYSAPEGLIATYKAERVSFTEEVLNRYTGSPSVYLKGFTQFISHQVEARYPFLENDLTDE